MIYIHKLITIGDVLFDLRHLRHLVAVAEEGTLHKASMRLHITQPAITKSIHALEDYLDARLFERQGRRLQLTDLGIRFVEQAKQILRSARDAETMVREWNEGSAGQITIGLGPAYTVLLSEQLIESVVRDFGSVDLHLETGDTKSLIKRLLDDTIDLAICDLAVPPPDGQLVVTDLPPQPIVALVRADHPLEQVASPGLADLSEFAVGHSPAPAQFAGISDSLATANRGTSLCLSENYEALVRVSKTSDMVTLLPLNLANAYAGTGEFSIVKLKDIPQASMPKILYREGPHALPPLGHRLIDQIKARFSAPDT